MAARATLSDVTELRRLLTAFHTQHQHRFGLQAECSHETCVEGRAAIVWLTRRLKRAGIDPIEDHMTSDNNLIALRGPKVVSIRQAHRRR